MPVSSTRSKQTTGAQMLVISLLLAGCATNTTLTPITDNHQPSDVRCEIRFFRDSKPSAPYDSIAKIESHVRKNLFFGGRASLEDEAYAELRTKTCAAGGDAVVIDDYVESSALEFSHVHVWATAIKLAK